MWKQNDGLICKTEGKGLSFHLGFCSFVSFLSLVGSLMKKHLTITVILMLTKLMRFILHVIPSFLIHFLGFLTFRYQQQYLKMYRGEIIDVVSMLINDYAQGHLTVNSYFIISK